MTRTVDHIVETHRLAQERRAMGRPVWDRRIELAHIWQDESLTFEQQRDQVVAALRHSLWVQEREELQEIVDELADTETGDEFDLPWNALYDEADLDRVWIATC